jgi:hypothetical protein
MPTLPLEPVPDSHLGFVDGALLVMRLSVLVGYPRHWQLHTQGFWLVEACADHCYGGRCGGHYADRFAQLVQQQP